MNKRLSPKDWAWLACAVDTEGSITENKSAKANGRMYSQIRVYNTEPTFIQHFAVLTGGTLFSYAHGGFGRKKIWACSISRRAHVQFLLLRMAPYLIVKKEKAEKILSWLQTHGKISRSTAMKAYWARLTPDEQLALKLKLHQARWARRQAKPEDPFSGLRPALPEGKE